MVAWKNEAEKMNAVWGEAAQERRVFQAKGLRLECEALALGDEVRSALKKGKTLLSAELKGVQKLLKKTAGTAKSASSRGEPGETPAPPPEAPPPAPPPPPLPPEQTGQAPEAPQRPPGTEAPGPGPERRKEKEGGPSEKPLRGDRANQDPSDSSSSSSSSSSDSDYTGDGTIESLLRHRRQERLRKKGKGVFMMEDLADVERDKKEKKLQIPKPDAYDGSVESNLTYQRRYETINDYLYHNCGSWEGD